MSGTLHFVTPKTDESRQVEVPERLYAMLEARKRGPNDLLFAGPRNAPLRWSNSRQIWRKAVAKAGLPDSVTPHQLRHACASILIAKGVHPKVIQHHLGHSSISVTMDIYGHLMPGQGGIVEAFANRLPSEKGV
jgi:integrase